MIRKVIKRVSTLLNGKPSSDSAVSGTQCSYSRYQELLDRYIAIEPLRMIEVGVWKGDRAVEFLTHRVGLAEYVGFDLFDDMTAEIHGKEGMALCFAQPMDSVRERLLQFAGSETVLTLVAGNTHQTLPKFVSSCQNRYDFVFVDGGHSRETVENDWKYVSVLLSAQGVCVFDDYYLDDAKQGCKELIDNLDTQRWDKDFFRGIERTVLGHYITMVAVTRHID